MKETTLIKVDAESNANHIYHMVQLDDSMFKTEDGRAGRRTLEKIYPMNVWDAILNKRVSEGFIEISQFRNKAEVTSKYEEIDDETVNRFFELMLKWTDEAIKNNYIIKDGDLNQAGIEKIQQLIDDLDPNDISKANDILKEIFSVFPRRMDDVKDYLVDNYEDVQDAIEREQSLLDMLESKVESDDGKAGKTILEAHNLTARPCTDLEIKQILSHLSPENQHKFAGAIRVSNTRTEMRYEKYKTDKNIQDVQYLYHGSRNENIWGIVKNGLKINPGKKVIRSGKMFGNGLYFATKSKKSVGYTSLAGSYWAGGRSDQAMLFVYKVAMGNPKHIYAWDSKCTNYTEKTLPKGFNSVFVHAGVSLRNDECIVYNDGACTLQYVILLNAKEMKKIA